MFGKRFKTERLRLGLTQQEIANKLGISRSNVANWENGSNVASNEMLLKCAELFDCSTDYLLGKENNMALGNKILPNVEELTILEFEKKSQAIAKDINNMDKILNNLPHGIFQYLELDYEYSPNSEEEIDFGLEDYTNFVELYQELINKKVIIAGSILTVEKLNDVLSYIKNNKEEIKKILDNKKSIHLKKWNDFKKSSLYKRYVEQLEKYKLD